RHARSQTERLRRFHCRCGMAHLSRMDHAETTGDPGRLQWWIARWRCPDAAAGVVSGGRLSGAAARYDSLSQLPAGEIVDPRVRQSRRSAAVSLAMGLLALSPRQGWR